MKERISTYDTQYGQQCNSEESWLGIGNWSCSETYQSWNGTSLGFTFSASGTTIAVRYTKVG